MQKFDSYHQTRIKYYSTTKNQIIDVKEVINIFKWVRETNNKYVDAAEEMFPGSSDFLENIYLRQVAMAEMSDDEIKRQIERQKAFFNRASYLLSDILRRVSIKEEQLFGALMLIDDCHHDFDYVIHSIRKDKSTRLALSAISEAMQTCNDLISKIHELPYQVQSLFERAYIAKQHTTNVINFTNYRHEDLLDELQVLKDALEICMYRSKNESKFLNIDHNQARTFVVESTYRLCFLGNGPRFVTTPGSDFSTLCSLMYELISGYPDESLAGAINRFAKSDERAQIDQDEEDLIIENGLGENVDNFYVEQKQILSAKKIS